MINLKKSKCTKILIVVIVALLLIFAGCGIYVNDYYRADETALAALVSDKTVSVQENENNIAFVPEDPTAGFIFYPGGKVEYTAYAPLLHNLAENGILCVLVEMPFNLAVLDMDAADGISEQYPQVDRWYIGGHSLGGSMAASYVSERIENYEGLVLLASYSTEDLSETPLDVISIYGSEDKVLNLEKYNEYHTNLPESLIETVIDGGCHACFGSYGPQDGDGIPSITAQEQILETTRLLTEFFLSE